MLKVALEGPINGCGDASCIPWRQRVIEQLKDKVVFHNPMDFDCRGKEAEMQRELIAFDTLGITSSDIVLVMAEKPGWGTAMAVQMAWNQHKIVVTICSNPKPSPWLLDRSTYFVSNLENAIELIKALFT